jgi:hypothetical protein
MTYFLDEMYEQFCSVCKMNPFFIPSWCYMVRECNSFHLFKHCQHTTLIISISVVTLILKAHITFLNLKSSETFIFYWMTLNSRRHVHLPYISRKWVCSKVFVRRWTNLYASTCLSTQRCSTVWLSSISIYNIWQEPPPSHLYKKKLS